MNPRPPEESCASDETPIPLSVPDLTRVWAAYGVSAAAGLHVIAAALVLINHSH
ncbi:hypothetical protein ACFV84_29365 [Kitasatospora sp. NPDC059811]|uniref:hypothetical protein n=1 Tax=Streptomycetaceae TaxID=2062 RepID=UPI000A8B20E2|nr:hypothetical protein [Streptomyces sp. MJM8645]